MAPATERRLIALAFALYCAIVSCLTALHGMWLDELQHWCLARDSRSLAELFYNTRNEGHPPLWHVLLFGITRLTSDPAWMQVLHVAIGMCTAALVLWRAPFVWWWRVLIVFGYFFLYEYTVIARNYGLVVFFLLLAADVRQRIGIGWQWAALLVLAAFTHLWGIVFAGAWVIGELFGAHARAAWRWCSIVLGGCVIAFWFCIPSDALPSGHLLGGTPLPNAVARIATITTQGLLPWPDLPSDRPWNHNLLHEGSRLLSALIGVVLLVALFLFAPRDRSARIFLVLALAGGIGLPIIGGFYSTRHYGPVFIAWLVLWWWLPNADRRRGARTFTSAILVCQAIGGLLCVAMSLAMNPLSRAHELPALSSEHAFQDLVVVVDAYTAGASVSGYLQRPVYFTSTGAMGSWCDWSHPEFVLNDTALIAAMDRVTADNFVWCTARPELRQQVADRMKAEVVLTADLTKAQVPTERIMVFHVRRP